MNDEPTFGNRGDDPTPRLRFDPDETRRSVLERRADSTDSALEMVELSLLDYVKIVYKRRWTAVTAFLIVFVSVTVYTFTATPIYEARTKVLIEAENPNVVSFKEVIDEGQTRTDYYQTQYTLLRSRSLTRRTLESLKLWNDSRFNGQAQEQSFSLRGAIYGALSYMGGHVRRILGSAGPDAPTAPDETTAQARAIDAVLANLRVEPVRNSRIVELAYRSPDPLLATRIVNTHARGFIEQNLEFKFLASKDATDWLGERLAEQRKQVEQAEMAFQRYREANDAISLEDRENIVVQKLADLNAAVTRAKTERIEKEALYNQLQAVRSERTALETFPAILTNAFIQQQKGDLANLQRQQAELAEKLGDRHPDMIKIRTSIQQAEAKLQGEVGKVVQSVRNEYLAAKAQEDSLLAALNAQKRDAMSLNQKAIEYGVLKREVESNRQIYDSLFQRAKETSVSTELKTSNVRIVDAAEVPRNRVYPSHGQNLLLALIGGGLLSLGLAMFFEYLDDRIKTPEEIKAHLDLPFLGLVPLTPAKGATAVHSLLLNNGVPADFVEAFRSVRTNVLFASAEEGTRSVAVTSTGPGEGKTVVASNLAMGLAQAGQRVLLIDGDMRRPRVHEMFGRKAEPGLSNLMVGNAKASETVRRTSVPGLWVLPAGRIPPNAAELLGSKRFEEFLLSLREHFEWVIIDTPPVMPVTDAALIAHFVSGVLFVIGAEMVSRKAARSALEHLDAGRARFLGAVLNRVDLHRNPYYYSQYYRREYSKYYTR